MENNVGQKELQTAVKRWKDMTSGHITHLDDWLDVGLGLLYLRKQAMLDTNSNRPRGKVYSLRFKQLREEHFNDIDPQSVTALLWLYDDVTAIDDLDDIRKTMTPGQRARLNSPISAKARVQWERSSKKGDAADESEGSEYGDDAEEEQQKAEDDADRAEDEEAESERKRSRKRRRLGPPKFETTSFEWPCQSVDDIPALADELIKEHRDQSVALREALDKRLGETA